MSGRNNGEALVIFKEHGIGIMFHLLEGDNQRWTSIRKAIFKSVAGLQKSMKHCSYVTKISQLGTFLLIQSRCRHLPQKIKQRSYLKERLGLAGKGRRNIRNSDKGSFEQKQKFSFEMFSRIDCNGMDKQGADKVFQVLLVKGALNSAVSA